MALKDVYNDIAAQYETADRFGALTQSHASAFSQLAQIPRVELLQGRILDLGIGSGRFLHTLFQEFPKASYAGIDISSEMLALAKESIPSLTTIEGGAESATQYIPLHSQNLILAHFVNAYVPIDTLFHQADLLLSSGGYFSVITSTYDSFPATQQYLRDFISQKTLLSKVVGHYYTSAVKQTQVAANQQALLETFEQYHFRVVAHQHLKIPVFIPHVHALLNFGIQGTWFLNNKSADLFSNALLKRGAIYVCEKIFPFPYQDVHWVEVVLAQKL